MKNLLCLLLATAFNLLFAQSENEINYTVEDGLPSNNVYCVEQDDRGYMWFGTDAGLSRFDGYEFKNYSLSDGLPDTEILNFYKDSKGRIWMYTLNGKVGYIQEGSIYTSENTDLLKNADLSQRISFIQETDKELVLASFRGEIKVISDRPLRSLNIACEFGYTWYCDGQFYFQSWEINKGYREKNLYTFSIGESGIEPLTKVQEFNSAELDIWQSYFVCVENVAVSSGMAPRKFLNYFDLTNLTHESVDVPFEVFNLGLRDGRIMLMTDSGMYWFSHSEGLEKINNYESVSDAYLDSEENQWITSLKNGVFFESKDIVMMINEKLKDVETLFTSESRLYLSNQLQHVMVLDSAQVVKKMVSYKSGWPIYFLLQDESLNFLYGSNGIFINNFNQRAYGEFFRIAAVHDSVLVAFNSEEFTFFSTNDYSRSLQTSKHALGQIYDLHLFSKDSFLIASDHGLHVWANDSLTEFSSDPLLSTRIYKIQYDDGNLWIATDGNGLLKLEQERIVQILTDDGLISNVCNNLLLTKSGIYVTTPRGISRVELLNNEYKIFEISKADGLVISKINDIELFNGKIYLAQDGGLAYFNENETFAENAEFEVFVDNVKVASQNVNLDHIASFSSNVAALEISFKALRYRNHSNLSYQYALIDGESKSEKWNYSKTNVVTFSSIGPGDYVFKVRAKTKNSPWTKSASYSFIVQPALWQRGWFQVLMYLIGIGLSLLIYRQFLKSTEVKKGLKLEKLNAELKALKAQINPHFLFNALNSIQSFILEDEKNIAQGYLVKYGQLMRKILDHSNELTVPLNEELEALNLYVELEQLRVKQGFDFEVQIDEAIDPYITNVPSMVIQPFIENAIWHGVSSLERNGKIMLSFSMQDETLQVKISDNGMGFDTNASTNSNHTSKGVQLVRERLELLKESGGEESVLEIKSQKGKGTAVVLRFSNDLS